MNSNIKLVVLIVITILKYLVVASTMRSEIINALLIREAATQRTTMEKWIGYEEEGFLIPRGRGTLDRIEGS